MRLGSQKLTQVVPAGAEEGLALKVGLACLRLGGRSVGGFFFVVFLRGFCFFISVRRDMRVRFGVPSESSCSRTRCCEVVTHPELHRVGRSLGSETSTSQAVWWGVSSGTGRRLPASYDVGVYSSNFPGVSFFFLPRVTRVREFRKTGVGLFVCLVSLLLI